MRHLVIILLFVTSACALKTARQMKTDATADAIVAHYKDHMDEPKKCYQPILNQTPNLNGRIVLEWTVNDKGEVKDAKISERTMDSKEIESCLLDHLQTMTFPAPPRFSKVTVTYTYKFKN